MQLSKYTQDFALLQIDKYSYRLSDIRVLIISSSLVDDQIDQRHQQVL
jgi:hypothetical protein